MTGCAGCVVLVRRWYRPFGWTTWPSPILPVLRVFIRRSARFSITCSLVTACPFCHSVSVAAAPYITLPLTCSVGHAWSTSNDTCWACRFSASSAFLSIAFLCFRRRRSSKSFASTVNSIYPSRYLFLRQCLPLTKTKISTNKIRSRKFPTSFPPR
jgi:hypothetical protein